MDAVLDVVKFLAYPFDDSEGPSKSVESTEALLENLIDKCLEKLQLEPESLNRPVDQEGESSSTWRFTKIILETLKELKRQVEIKEANQPEEEKCIEVISLQTQTQVQKCLELVIGFGILPYLVPGLGVSSKVRKLHSKVPLFIEKDQRESDLHKFFRLAHTVEVLLNLCDNPSLHSIILPKHSDDVLAAYLLLCLSPVKNPLSPSGASLQAPGLTADEYALVMEKRKNMILLFETKYFQKVSKVTVVNSLLVQGATTKPRWVARSCQEMIHRILLKSENGLATISQAVIESLGRANIWKGARVVTNLVKEAVRCSENAESAVSSFCHQAHGVMETIRAVGKDTDESQEQLTLIATCSGLTFLNICKPVAMKNLWQPVFRPLLNIYGQLQQSEEAILTISDLESCIYFASKLVAAAPTLDFTFPLDDFIHIWSVFLQIFIMCSEFLSRKIQDPDLVEVAESLQRKLHSVLTAIFAVCESLSQSQEQLSEKSFSVSQFFISLVLNDDRQSLSFSINRFCFELYGFVEEADNIIQIRARKIRNDETDVLEVLASDCAVICSSFFRDDLRKVGGRLLSELLSFAEKRNPECDHIGNKALTGVDIMERENCEKFIGLELLAELGKDERILEDLGAMEDPAKMLNFLELILGKQVLELESSSRSGEDYEFSQSLMFSLTILSALCDAKKGGISSALIGEEIKYDWKDLRKFLPHLQKLRDTLYPGLVAAGIPNMAEDIMIIIETRGVGGLGKEKKAVSRFQSALQDVGNPMLPVKGHGLLELRRLVEERDEEALQNEGQLLQIFQREMRNEDSYIYLMAIKGMAAIAVKFHSSIVPLLIKEYGSQEDSHSGKLIKSMKSQERAEFCMKVGEVLVSIVKQLGKLAPVYKGPLTNVFFHLVRDDDPLIRASALSNLGELCHLLNFDLGTVLTEVWYCLEALFQIEKHVEVRRAALHLLVLLLRGIEKEFSPADVLNNEEYGRHLRDVRRLITRIHESDPDTVSKIHCQLALQEIELIVRKLILPSDKLEYKIRVLDRF